MRTDNIAIETYKYFSTLEGNQYIASEFALKVILEIIHNYKVKNVLELGVGIGSISYSVFEYAQNSKRDIHYVATETNSFCLDVLPRYLNKFYDKLTIYNEINELSRKDKFDVIIIDGKDENMEFLEKLISKNGIIIIEGFRINQLKIIRDIFPNSIYTRVISNYMNPVYGPISSNHYAGGVQLIFVNPTLKQKMNYLSYRVGTAVKYRLRALK